MQTFDEWVKTEGIGAFLGFGPKLDHNQQQMMTALMKQGYNRQQALNYVMNYNGKAKAGEQDMNAAFQKGGSGFMDTQRWNALKQPTTTA